MNGLVPMKLPNVMPGVKIKQSTPFGNMHVKIIYEQDTGYEREIFAQMGKAGELTNSHLEAICRICSLYLRVGGDILDLVNQLEGIGSSLSVSTTKEQITSIPDALARAIKKYLEHKHHSSKNKNDNEPDKETEMHHCA